MSEVVNQAISLNKVIKSSDLTKLVYFLQIKLKKKIFH